jgi:hypothetical protein
MIDRKWINKKKQRKEEVKLRNMIEKDKKHWVRKKNEKGKKRRIKEKEGRMEIRGKNVFKIF